MFFDPWDEFPHTSTLLEQRNVPNGMGGVTKQWVELEEIECFIDTPSTDRIVEFSKLGVTMHRDLYVPYQTSLAFKPNMRVRYHEREYEFAGTVEDQGGMHEVSRVPLKRID